MKRSLIVFSSLTGNTAKVAERFKSTFLKNGWECDMHRLALNFDYMNPPFKYQDYDLVCVGSGLIMHLPSEVVLNSIQRQFYDIDPKILKAHRYEFPRVLEPPVPGRVLPEASVGKVHRKIVVDCSPKRSIIFVTYGGYEFGPVEAQPAMALLELEIMHLGFRPLGHFCCPGKFGNRAIPSSYHGDITGRPNEQDLLKAELFLEEKLEEITERPPKSDI
jgi:hypothetical protein